ncbi:hypothetical protein JCM5353_008686 [Sporobolomyces roseus]
MPRNANHDLIEEAPLNILAILKQVHYKRPRDLIEAREAVQKDRLTVSQFWLALAGQTLDLTVLEAALSDYLEASGNAFPKIQHIYSAPVYSWHTGSAQPRQLSLRKQAIYRNRF